MHFYSNLPSRRRDSSNKISVMLKISEKIFAAGKAQLFSSLRKTRKMDVCPTMAEQHSLKRGSNAPYGGQLRAPESLCNNENRKTLLIFVSV